MTGTDLCVNKPHLSRSYLNHLVYICRGLFRKLEILPVPCQYILSLILLIIDNPNNFRTGLEKHGLHTNVKINFSFQLLIITSAQKVISYSGVKIYNSLSSNI